MWVDATHGKVDGGCLRAMRRVDGRGTESVAIARLRHHADDTHDGMRGTCDFCPFARRLIRKRLYQHTWRLYVNFTLVESISLVHFEGSFVRRAISQHAPATL